MRYPSIKYPFVILLICCTLFTFCKQRIRPKHQICTATMPFRQDTSFLSTPVIIPAKVLHEKINAAVKHDILSDDNFDNISKITGRKDHIKLDVNRIGDIDITWKDNVATCEVPLLLLIEREILSEKLISTPFSMKAALKLRVVFDITLNITEDWKLKSSTKFRNFEWLSDARAFGGLISVKKPIQNRIMKHIPFIEPAIDSQIYARVHLDRAIRKIWCNMQRPIALNKEHRLVWLQIQPLRFDIGPIRTEGNNLVIPGRMHAFTKTLVGENPAYQVDSILPPARKFANLPDSVFVYMLARIPYQHLKNVILNQVGRKPMSLEGRNLTLSNIEIWGCGDKMVVHLSVAGDVNGEIYMQGIPSYERDSQLVIRQFDFDIDTRETLLSGADWLLHDTFRKQIQDLLTLPLQQQIVNMPSRIEANIESGRIGDRVDLDIESWKFTPKRIVMQEDHLAVLITSQGKVQLVLEKI